MEEKIIIIMVGRANRISLPYEKWSESFISTYHLGTKSSPI